VCRADTARRVLETASARRGAPGIRSSPGSATDCGGCGAEGGIGKTRLALAVAADVAGRFPDGTWYADLVLVAEAAMLPAAVTTAIGLSESSNRPAEDVPLVLGARTPGVDQELRRWAAFPAVLGPCFKLRDLRHDGLVQVCAKHFGQNGHADSDVC
jgi:hypothetical protein